MGLTVQAVFAADHRQDVLALKIIHTSAHYLGHGLSILIDVLNPEVIVIGSIFARQLALLWPVAAEVIAQEAIPPAMVCVVWCPPHWARPLATMPA